MRLLFLTKHRCSAAKYLFALLHVLILSLVVADNPELRHSRSPANSHRRNSRRHVHRPESRLAGRRETINDGNVEFISRPYTYRQQRNNYGHFESTLTTHRGDYNFQEIRDLPTRNIRPRDLSSRRQHRQSSQFNRESRHSRRNAEDHITANPAFNADKNCTFCWKMEYDKHRRIESLKTSILKKLGLKSPPNITRGNLPKIPPLSRYIGDYGMSNDEPSRSSRQYEDDDDDDDESVIKRIILLSKPAPVKLGLPRHGVSYFEFKPDLRPSRIHKAHLSLFIKRPEEESPTSAYINIFRFRKSSGRVYKIFEKKRYLNLFQRGGRWITFDLTRLVQNWVTNPRRNYGLFINATMPNILVEQENERDAPYRPYLDISLKSKKSRRMRRTSGSICDIHSKVERCCRYPLEIDFVEFGWDWVIAPKHFRANFCTGDCPYLFQSSFMHSVVLSQHFPAGVKGPCCSPKKLKAISLIYFDGDGIINLGTLPGMIVEKCGCS